VVDFFQALTQSSRFVFFKREQELFERLCRFLELFRHFHDSFPQWISIESNELTRREAPTRAADLIGPLRTAAIKTE
jgi:hypothetical protein